MNLVRTARPPMLAGIATLGLALAAWITVVAQMQSMGASSMGLGPPGSFLPLWVAMMAGMMLPAAAPFVFGFASRFAQSANWPVGSVVLAATYLLVWTGFGMVAYLVYQAIGMPWPRQNVVVGVAIAAAGIYALTPLKRAAQARCRAMCYEVQTDRRGIVASAVTRGIEYGLNCVGCSAGLMIALLIVGMSNLVWSIVATGVVLLYKVAPWWSNRTEYAASIALLVAGVSFALVASGM
jgi:predicted metal-binding membrane protein